MTCNISLGATSSSFMASSSESQFCAGRYGSVFEKAAALMQSLAENQPFLEGNKRIAWLCGKQGDTFFRDRVAMAAAVLERAHWIESRATATSSG